MRQASPPVARMTRSALLDPVAALTSCIAFGRILPLVQPYREQPAGASDYRQSSGAPSTVTRTSPLRLFATRRQGSVEEISGIRSWTGSGSAPGSPNMPLKVVMELVIQDLSKSIMHDTMWGSVSRTDRTSSWTTSIRSLSSSRSSLMVSNSAFQVAMVQTKPPMTTRRGGIPECCGSGA